MTHRERSSDIFFSLLISLPLSLPILLPFPPFLPPRVSHLSHFQIFSPSRKFLYSALYFFRFCPFSLTLSLSHLSFLSICSFFRLSSFFFIVSLAFYSVLSPFPLFRSLTSSSFSSPLIHIPSASSLRPSLEFSSPHPTFLSPHSRIPLAGPPPLSPRFLAAAPLPFSPPFPSTVGAVDYPSFISLLRVPLFLPPPLFLFLFLSTVDPVPFSFVPSALVTREVQ